MAYKPPDDATRNKILQFAYTFFPTPDCLVEIRYEPFPHGIRATVVVTPKVNKAISNSSAHTIINALAREMQNHGIGDGDRPCVVIQPAEQ